MAVATGVILDHEVTISDTNVLDSFGALPSEPVLYRNRVWDTMLGGGGYHYWNSYANPDTTGSSYDGPGTWGVHTEDFCSIKI